jgi:DNA-binding response OmpR family regulator
LSKYLLIVDDEPNLLRAVAACLRREGYEVETARSGEEALVHVAQRLPDLIVSDIRMSRMDGYALARQLRNNPRTHLIPIIFLTAKDESSDRIAGIRSGVDAYLTKPFEPDELVAVIDNILSRVERTHAEIARLIGSNLREQIDFTDEELTEAERRIASAVAAGLSNKEIAAELAGERSHGRKSHQPYSREKALRQPRRDRPLRPGAATVNLATVVDH